MLRFAIFCTNEQKLLKIRTTFHLPGDYFWTNRNCQGFENSLTLGLPNQKMKLWVGHDYAAGSCCDLDLQGSDPNVARDALSHYGDHFCEIVLKFNFK